jgi:hypothetical protein
VKKVSTIIYHHILHSHQNIPEASEEANLFSETMLYKQNAETLVTVLTRVPCTLPSFMFTTHKASYGKDIDTSMSKYKIFQFISIIVSWLHMHLEWVIISLVYLEKLMTQSNVEIRISNWRPLLLTCLILSWKYWEEWGYWNSDFAEITDFPVEQINRLESTAISLLNYKLFISANLYSQYYFEVRALYRKIKAQEEKERKKRHYLKYGVVNSRKSNRKL